LLADDPADEAAEEPSPEVEATTAEAVDGTDPTAEEVSDETEDSPDDDPAVEEINYVSEAAAESFGEASPVLMGEGFVTQLSEGVHTWDGVGPLKVDVVMVRPGPGNERDKHYYPREVLRRDAGVFEGGKMYATDHREEERSVLTEVADILKCPVGFTADGAPIAQVGIFNPQFARAVYNRHLQGSLSNLHTSIYGAGEVQRGRVGEGEYNIVAKILRGAADFVTSAGAGGHVMAISEADRKGRDMEKDEVREILKKRKGVPQPVLERLAEGDYTDEAAVEAAITAELSYLKEVTGAGDIFGENGDSPEVKPKRMTLAEMEAEFDKVDRAFGLRE
jgi:hypothetical protein